MTEICPFCGRDIPENKIECPHCFEVVATHGDN